MTITRTAAIRCWLPVVALLAVTACSGDDDDASTATEASTTTVALAPAGPAYSTRYLDPPIDVVVPDFVDPEPADEAANLVTWQSAGGEVAIRIMRPVNVYRPGETTTSDVPADYVAYLLSQADHGAQLSDRADTTVDGHEATVFTAVTDEALDGSLGCPGPDIAADACFGLQPDISLRLAVITTDEGPLLVWIRSAVDDAELTAAPGRLDELLLGITFADRAVEEAPAAFTEYDGAYTWTITQEDALAHGLPSDRSPEGLATYPTTFTATLHEGRFVLAYEPATGPSGTEHDRYEASSGRISFYDGSLVVDVVQDADGTLRFTPVEPVADPGAAFVLATEPWVPAPAEAGRSRSAAIADVPENDPYGPDVVFVTTDRSTRDG